MSKEMKVALVGGIFTIIAAIIGGLFVLYNTASVQSNTYATSQPIASTSTPTQSNSSAISLPVATQAAQPTYPDIRGTYSIYLHSPQTGRTTSMGSLKITQQDQQIFKGSVGSNSDGFDPINNGIVDQQGNIQFSINEMNSGTQLTMKFTGIAQSGGGWQGTWSTNTGDYGTWYAN